MSWIAFNLYVIITVAIVIATVYSIVKIPRSDKLASSLIIAGYIALICVFSYFVRVLTESIVLFAWMTSLHLICIDFALLFFLKFVIQYTKFNDFLAIKKLYKIFFIVALFDSVFLLINPIINIVIDFEMRKPLSLYARVVYSHQHFLYFLHIGLAYAIILFILILLGKRLVIIPKEFRRQYSYTIIALSIVFVVNFITVFIQGNQNYLNYSVSAYCLMEIIMYVFAYKYSSFIMLTYYKESIFETVDQGIVLFDYEGRFVMRNTKAIRMLPLITFNSALKRQEFENKSNVIIDPKNDLDAISLQCSIKVSTGVIPLRCDYRKLRNNSGELLGYLYVFSNIGLDTNMITGFHNWSSFKNFVLENANSFSLPLMIVVSDIDNLSVINSTHGKTYGDELLKNFAKALRKVFPNDAYFVHADNARLIIFSYNMKNDDVENKMELVRQEFSNSFLYATELISDNKSDIINAVKTATKALYQKKLVRGSLKHSDKLNSLIKSLKECDNQIELHIEEIQKLCRKISIHMGLNDKQKSDLDLLCMLHDIGKISISSEILNKKGPLTHEEIRIMRTHADKGYQIIKSSRDFVDIALCVRSHHEHFDGKGYPDGLSGENIPLLSRILSVVDSYDAMIHDRPYRPAMVKEIAISELKACAGTQFDPNIVLEFLQILGEDSLVLCSLEKREQVDSFEDVVEQSTNEKEPNIKNLCKVDYSRYILDGQNKIVSVDENFEKLTGYSRDDIRERKLEQGDLIPEEDRMDYLCLTAETLANNQFAYFEHRLLKKNKGHL